MLLLAFQNWTTLMICFPAQMGKVRTAISWGRVIAWAIRLVIFSDIDEGSDDDDDDEDEKDDNLW
jgi:hypothetical protein